jgi:outer membrane receptor for ferrienterochelin and colicin
MKRILLSLLTLAITAIGSFAQTGTIRGKITGGDTGEELIGANVMIIGTYTGGAADIDGNYNITNLEPGSYQLVAQYISYQPDTFTVVVKAKEVTVKNIALQSAAIMVEAFTVEAKAIRSSENYMLTLQKKSATVMNGISSQQISKGGDSDAAGAVKRVSGVSVEGGKYVYVRGLSDRYVKTTLNGAEIPGLDPDRNAVQLDLFPTNLIDNLTVMKSFSPDLPASFTAGLVNIETKDFPERYTFQFSASLGFNENATFNDKFVTSAKSKTDFLGFDNGDRAVPSEVKNSFVPHLIPTPTADNSKLTRLGKSFNKDVEVLREAPTVNQSYSLSVGNQKTFLGKPVGLNLGLTYSKNYEFYDNGKRGRYTLTGQGAETLNNELDFNDTRGEENVVLGLLVNTSIKLTPNHKIALTLLRNQNGISYARILEGSTPSDEAGITAVRNTIGYTERAINSGQFKGEHYMENLHKLKVTWLTSYTQSSQNEPDLRFNNMDYKIDPKTNDTIFSIQPSRYAPPNRFYREMVESNLDAKVNVELPFATKSGEDIKTKFGLSNVRKQREFTEERYEFRSQETLPFMGSFADYFKDENFDIDPGAGDGYLYVTDASELRNQYDGFENVLASFAMVDFHLNTRLRIITGARIEITQIESESKNPTIGKGSLDNSDLLPALNLTYALTDKTNLRMGYSKTLARPSFREIAPFSSFSFSGGEVRVGNPKLKRTLIDNLDLRWDRFGKLGEIFSVGGFYKKFKNPIELVIVPQAQNVEITWQNVDEAIAYGAELEFKKNLGFISPRLKKLNSGGNLTVVQTQVSINDGELQAIREGGNPEADDKREMFGQSPYIVNAFLGYVNDSLGLQANLNFNVAGKKLALVTRGATPNVFEQPRPLLDFNVSKTLSKHWSIKVAASNLLNPETKRTYDYKSTEYVFQQYQIGRTYSLGISYLIK